jgi:hypothetical protein
VTGEDFLHRCGVPELGAADDAVDRDRPKSRLSALLDHFADVEDPHDVRRILHPLPEILLLVACGSIADCDDDDEIAASAYWLMLGLRDAIPKARALESRDVAAYLYGLR